MRPKKVVLCVGTDRQLELRVFLLETRGGYRCLRARDCREASLLMMDRGRARIDGLLVELPMEYLDLLLQSGRRTQPEMRSLVLGPGSRFDESTTADAYLPASCSSSEEILERLRILMTRKRGPYSAAGRAKLAERRSA